MREPYCFWSIAHGHDRLLIEAMVQSARAVGVFKEFHVWTDRPIGGAVCHSYAKPAKSAFLFQLEVLQRRVKRLQSTWLVWLDPSTYFVRHPGNVLRVLFGAPVHASLESDLSLKPLVLSEWKGCSVTNYCRIMRFCGVHSRAIFSVHSGFWIVHHDVIDTFCELAWDFWEFCQRAGYVFGIEPPLAYAAQMLCVNPYLHTLRNTADIWASDRAGRFARELPHGQSWDVVDTYTGEAIQVNPAMVQLPNRRTAPATKRAEKA